MPSPIAHTAAGYLVYYLSRTRQPELKVEKIGPLPTALMVSVGFSLLPDVDSIAGLLLRDFGRYHNNATHSLMVGSAAALLFGAAMWRRQRAGFRYWFVLAWCSYILHVVMDSATISRGVMAFWPLTTQRFLMPFRLFYGFHWSDGFFSIRHLWTILTEGAFASILTGLTHLHARQKHLTRNPVMDE